MSEWWIFDPGWDDIGAFSARFRPVPARRDEEALRDLLQRFYQVEERRLQAEEPRRKAELRLVDLEERRMQADLAWMQTNVS